ncbi:hypothetical protein ACHAW6_005642 [Cyclotella cf. meneghiniana]
MSNEAEYALAEEDKMDEGTMQTRTMEIPLWLSTPEVTKFLVGGGKKAHLESEYECLITITGEGSGTKDPNAPGNDLPYLQVTMEGTDIRQLGRARRAIEDSLIDYVIENTPEAEDHRSPPPSLGRLLYALALSAANSSPKTKDHSEHRTVLARAHYPMSALRRQGNKNTKKVWMNVVELPVDDQGTFHGRFLAGRGGSLFEFYRSKYNCEVNIYGVWGEGDEDPRLLCDPYVLVTSEESKQQVDKCVQFIGYRIKEHEEKYGVSREHGDE